MDKIGDLVLSLGVDQHPDLAGHKVEWLIPKGIEFVVDACIPKRSYHSWDKSYSSANKEQLVKWLKEQNYDAAVFFQGEKWLMHALKAAEIPLRVGQRSDIRSFFAFNKGIRQKRSSSNKSEFQLNQELVEKGLGLSVCNLLPPTKLQAEGNTPEVLNSKKYVVVHAGMGGSALNWSQEKYIESIKLLLGDNFYVVLTGTKPDLVYLDKILKEFENNEKVINLVDQISAKDLLNVLGDAQAVLAPSTGVLHLSASLGTKSIGIYPPIHVQRPNRWGAYGERVVNIQPEVDCPEKFRCRGAACSYYPCMESMGASSIVGELLK
jgi:ADP-heptose:LPS heptosyltransferase